MEETSDGRVSGEICTEDDVREEENGNGPWMVSVLICIVVTPVAVSEGV
jgi:hypothetical protein